MSRTRFGNTTIKLLIFSSILSLAVFINSSRAQAETVTTLTVGPGSWEDSRTIEPGQEGKTKGFTLRYYFAGFGDKPGEMPNDIMVEEKSGLRAVDFTNSKWNSPTSPTVERFVTDSETKLKYRIKKPDGGKTWKNGDTVEIYIQFRSYVPKSVKKVFFKVTPTYNCNPVPKPATVKPGKCGVDSCHMDMPLGIVGSDTTISVGESPRTDAQSLTSVPAGFSRIAVAYEFSPDGFTFNLPTTITIPYQNYEITGLDEHSLRAFVYDPDTSSWSLIPGSTVDVSANTVTFQTTHFSLYGIGGDILPPTGVNATWLTVMAVLSALAGTAVIWRIRSATPRHPLV